MVAAVRTTGRLGADERDPRDPWQVPAPLEGPVLSSRRGEKTGAGEGIRTLDPNLGKVVLYP